MSPMMSLVGSRLDFVKDLQSRDIHCRVRTLGAVAMRNRWSSDFDELCRAMWVGQEDRFAISMLSTELELPPIEIA